MNVFEMFATLRKNKGFERINNFGKHISSDLELKKIGFNMRMI